METVRNEFEGLSDYDLEVLMREAIEEEDYLRAAAIQREQERRLKEPETVRDCRGGYNEIIYIAPAADLLKLGDTEVTPSSFSSQDPPSPFYPNPYSVLPPEDQRRIWEDYKMQPIEFGTSGVPYELFDLIFRYIEQSEYLCFKELSVEHRKGSDFSFSLLVRNSREGFEALEAFRRCFFP